MSQINTLFQKLSATLATAVFLTTETNPVTRDDCSGVNLCYVLGQYSLFPKHIVTMLTLAKSAAGRCGLMDVVSELERNIGQELGSDSDSLPHYQLLAMSLQAEFGLSAWAAIPAAATDRFIRSMWSALEHENPFYVLGVAYALESSAVPELTVVLEIVQRLAGDRALLPQTKQFFDRHLATWEPSHEAELRQVLEPLLEQARNRAVFEDGFLHVMEAMHAWWDALALEVF